MTDTPIIDSAIRAAKNVNGGEVSRDYTVASLRAALPWDLPPERLGSRIAVLRALTLDAYRADPIMRELWPEKF